MFYVWEMHGNKVMQPAYGPFSLKAAKQYARIAATHGRHNRLVTKGRWPHVPLFRIEREYAAGSGRHVLRPSYHF